MRQITRVLCGDPKKRHTIGYVCADAEGLFVSYTAEVAHPGKVFGSDEPVIDRLPELDAVMFLGGYCKGCNRPVQINGNDLRQAAITGVKEIRVPFTDTIDNAWADAGYPPLYSPETRRERHDPRK